MNRLTGLIDRLHSAAAHSTARTLYFTRPWRFAAAGTLLAGLVTQTMSIALIGGLVLATIGVSRLWNETTLAEIEFRRELDMDRALPGDHVNLSLTVINRKPLPAASLRIDEHVSEWTYPVNQRSTMSGTSGQRLIHLDGNLRPYERQTWRITLECQKRGSHMIGPAVLRSGDPFGFFSIRSNDHANKELLVYPRVHRLDDLELPNQRPLGDQIIAATQITDPMRIRGLRDYRPEDPLRSIHWKATARHRSLQVKIEEPVATLSMMILLNLDSFEHAWEGVDLDNVELSIEVAASYAMWALGHRFAVGLQANGVVAGSDQPLNIPVGRGDSQRLVLMTGLARLGAYATLPFVQTVAAAAPSVPLGSTLLMITPMMTSEIAGLLAKTIARGRRTVLVPLGNVAPPEIPGLIVRDIHFPVTPVREKAA